MFLCCLGRDYSRTAAVAAGSGRWYEEKRKQNEDGSELKFHVSYRRKDHVNNASVLAVVVEHVC